jgi:hypothetical protein
LTLQAEVAEARGVAVVARPFNGSSPANIVTLLRRREEGAMPAVAVFMVAVEAVRLANHHTTTTLAARMIL